MKMQGMAVAWFREADWPRWCAMDCNFQPSYQYWLRRMEAVFTRYKAAGAPVIKVVLDPDEFLKWSNATGRGVGTDARAAFAVFKSMALDREGKH